MATTASAAATLIPSQIRSSSSLSSSTKKKSGGNSLDGLNINAKEFIPPKESNTTHHSEGIGEGNSKQPSKRPRNRKRNPNNNNNKQKKNNKNSNRKQNSSDESKTNNEELSAGNSKTTTEITETVETTEATKKKNRKKLPRNRRGGLPNNNNQNNNNDDDDEGKQKGNNTDKKKNRPKSKKKKGPKKNNNKKNAKAWRNYIPEGAVDPITLDPLDSLNYPPFALFIEPPYKPVNEWPPASCICDDANNNEKNDKNDSSTAAAAAAAVNEEEIKKYHLFDGRVLAYYLVSQLQFIDPLNRRDLTSEEIISLDKYLKKYNLGNAKVYEAYQKKGTTINSAGQIAQSAQGRARMLQQEASSILQSLFHNNTGGGNNNIDVLGSTHNHHHHHQQQQQTHNRSATNESSFRNDFRREYNMNNHVDNNDNNPYGVMGDLDSGLVVIDDNINPGLRSGASRPSTSVVEESFPPLLSSGTSTRNNAFANSLSSTYSQQQESTTQEESFPTLHASSTDNINNTSTSTTGGVGKYNNVVTRSLKIASKLITKTDPKEVAKQKKARQEAQRRAALSQLTLLNPTTTNTNNNNNNELEDQKHSSSATPHSYDIEARVERNRAVAEALNIKPSIMHMNAPTTGTPTFHSGWTCPILQKEDIFKKELEMTLYPESLILLAKEQMTSLDELIKLDKKWTRFLRDDKASYINLKPMLKPKRIMVHTYSDYWNLQTQSFDKDPKRYICCKKSLGETRAPYPLLSDVVRLYRKGSMKNFGVLSTTANTTSASSNNKDNANGGGDMDTIRKRDPSLMSTQEGDGDERKQQQLPPREFPPAGDRTPLPLLPPQNIMMNPAPGTMYDTYSNTNANNNASTTTTPEPPNNNNNNNSRFSSLAPSSQDRPKLNLQPRTIPTTLPPPPQEEKLLPSDHLADIYRKKKADLEQKLILEQKKKQAILESAFASDDEDEEEERASKKGSFNDYDDVNDESSGAWDEEDEAYCSSSSDSE